MFLCACKLMNWFELILSHFNSDEISCVTGFFTLMNERMCAIQFSVNKAERYFSVSRGTAVLNMESINGI